LHRQSRRDGCFAQPHRRSVPPSCACRSDRNKTTNTRSGQAMRPHRPATPRARPVLLIHVQHLFTARGQLVAVVILGVRQCPIRPLHLRCAFRASSTACSKCPNCRGASDAGRQRGRCRRAGQSLVHCRQSHHLRPYARLPHRSTLHCGRQFRAPGTRRAIDHLADTHIVLGRGKLPGRGW
jgi:hypothetical protein